MATAAVVAMDGSGTASSSKSGQERDEKEEISKITDYLYLSGCISLVADKATEQLRLTCAINCIRGIRHVFPASVEYLTVPLEDEEEQSLKPYMEQVLSLIDKHRAAGGCCLVYCGLGISRSASFVIAHLMRQQRLTLVDAYKHVQVRRRIICPNVGFFRQLIDMERRMYTTTTVNIIEPAPGVLVPDVVWAEIYDEVLEKIKNGSLDIAN